MTVKKERVRRRRIKDIGRIEFKNDYQHGARIEFDIYKPGLQETISISVSELWMALSLLEEVRKGVRHHRKQVVSTLTSIDNVLIERT